MHTNEKSPMSTPHTETKEIGAKVFLIPFQIGAGLQDDLVICNQLKTELAEFDVTISSNQIGDVIEIFNQADLIIACRFHSLILARYFRKDYRLLSYHEKVQNFIGSDSNKIYPLSVEGLEGLFKLL